MSGDVSSPYVGTRPFETCDREIFFGREHEAREIADLWLSHRITLLHGEAGVGKTSVLHAGVVPELVDEPVRILSIGRLACRSDFPLAAVPEQNLFTLALLSSWFPAESPTRLAGLPVLAALRRYPPRHRSGNPIRTLAAIDAAELLFREPEPNHRQRTRFLDELVEAVNGQPALRLILVVKEDHLSEAVDFASRAGAGDLATYLLKPFDRDGAMRAAQGTHGSLGAEVAALLVDEFCKVRSPWGVPDHAIPHADPALLQLLCARLWADLRPETGISAPQLAVEVNRVLSEFCGQALVSVANDHGLPMSRLRSWFRETFAEQPSGGVPERQEQVNGLPISVVRAVEDRRLVKARMRSGERCYELQHPRLAEAIELLGDKSVPMRGPDPVARLRAGELALAESLVDLARRHADAVVRACGNGDLSIRAQAECLLGNIAHQRGDPKLAVTHYRRAARLFEAIHNTLAVGHLLTAMGRLMLDEKKVADALRELRAAVQRLPNDLTAQTALGQALWQSGQSQAALAVLNGVLTRDGDTPEALRTRGEIMADLGHAESALRDLRRVDHAARPSTQAAWALAQAMRQPGETGLRELDTAADAPDSGPVLLRVARVRQLTGHRADAVAYAERAVVAEHPPLPLQLQAEAHRLISGS